MLYKAGKREEIDHMKRYELTILISALLALTVSAETARDWILYADEGYQPAPTPETASCLVITAKSEVGTLKPGKLIVGDAATSVIFTGGVAGEWLTVERHNIKSYDPRAFDPSYVDIVSDFKPILKKRADGKWTIEFVSELTERK